MTHASDKAADERALAFFRQHGDITPALIDLLGESDPEAHDRILAWGMDAYPLIRKELNAGAPRLDAGQRAQQFVEGTGLDASTLQEFKKTDPEAYEVLLEWGDDAEHSVRVDKPDLDDYDGFQR